MSKNTQLKFPGSARMKKTESFAKVFKNRNSISDSNILLYGKPNNLKISRLGLSVSKKLGGAVIRNRYKRCLREAFRLCRNSLPQGYDWVIIPRPTQSCATGKYVKSLLSLTPRIVKKQNKRNIENKQPNK